MKRTTNYLRSSLTSIETVEGETIEQKVERIVQNKEPIKDGAPEIYTERKEGVIQAYNIRADRWEIATDAMDKVQASIQAKREDKGKVIDINKDNNDVGDKSVQDTAKTTKDKAD